MRKRKKKPGSGGHALFGLPFFLAGLLVFYIGVSEILNAQEAKDWLQVDVFIETLTIKTHADSDGTTYSVETKYTYSFEGENYTGYRFSFATGSDNVTDYQEQINRVRARNPAYGFMNPDQPKESVLKKEIPGTANFLIPFGLVFIIVGLSLIIGGITLKIEQKTARTLYKTRRQVRPSRVRAFLPLAILTGGTSFAMVFINVIVLANILDPLNTLFVTLAVLSIAFGGGLVLAVRSLRDSKIFLQIKTPPGASRPFEVEVDFNRVKPDRKVELSNTSANVDVSCQTQTRSSSSKKTRIATLGMKHDGIYQHSINLKMDPQKVQVIDHLSQLAPQEMDMVTQMGVAMAGGPDAPEAKKEVRESLKKLGANLSTRLVLDIDNKKLEFQLPLDIWQEINPA